MGVGPVGVGVGAGAGMVLPIGVVEDGVADSAGDNGEWEEDGDGDRPPGPGDTFAAAASRRHASLVLPPALWVSPVPPPSRSLPMVNPPLGPVAPGTKGMIPLPGLSLSARADRRDS